ncbi:MAG: hypothetical protein PHF11_07375, partial [Candidatus Omnitrophica bacterium]|nr:hypothetical protein [Candidatus Omnitrophota bacterium]
KILPSSARAKYLSSWRCRLLLPGKSAVQHRPSHSLADHRHPVEHAITGGDSLDKNQCGQYPYHNRNNIAESFDIPGICFTRHHQNKKTNG